LSVDLLTDTGPGEEDDNANGSEAEERLDGEVVRRIWTLSKLGRAVLKSIWAECDPAGTGTLDRESFVKGMWRIDEELRRAQIGGGRFGAGVPGAGMSTARHGSMASARAMGAGPSGSSTKLILR